MEAHSLAPLPMITIDPPSSVDPDQTTVSKPALARFLRRARLAAGVTGAVDVLLTTDREMRRLNRRFRGKNKPTDVLSFPASQEVATKCAGDLAISLDTAARQAQAFQHSVTTEVRVLLLHGLLHLAGMDHEADGGEMAAAEQRLRRELRLPNSLIARVDASVVARSQAVRGGSRAAGKTHPRNAVAAPAGAR